MTKDQVANLLTDAERVVDAAGVARDLREAAFVAAVRLLAREEEVPRPGLGTPAVPSTATGTASEGREAANSYGLLGKIAAGLELDPAEVGRLYTEKDGVPELILKAKKLPKTTSAAAQDISILVMAGRQLAGVEESTEAKVLWAACKRYGKFDSGNFASHMKSLDNAIITRGHASSAKRALTQPGIEHAAELAKKYLGEDQE